MHVSLYINPQTSGPDHDYDVIKSVTETVKYAEDNGYSAIYLTEHHTTGYNAYSDPLQYAAYLAPYIKRMTMSFSVAVLPFHHPLRFATQCSFLDNVYEGRFIAGIGTGNSPLEYEAFGLPRDDKYTLMNENIEAVLGCWAGNYEHHGKYFDFKMERVVPAPYTKPHPRVTRAVVSMDSLDDSARRAWPVLLGRFPEERIKQYVDRYREGIVSAGHSQAVQDYCLGWMSMLKLIYCAESEEQAYEELRPVLIRYLIQTAKANSSDYILEEQAGEQADDFIKRAMFVGTPKQIADGINSYGEVGITNMLVWQSFGEMSHEQTMRSLKLFTEKTMPLINLETEAPRGA